MGGGLRQTLLPSGKYPLAKFFRTMAKLSFAVVGVCLFVSFGQIKFSVILRIHTKARCSSTASIFQHVLRDIGGRDRGIAESSEASELRDGGKVEGHTQGSPLKMQGSLNSCR